MSSDLQGLLLLLLFAVGVAALAWRVLTRVWREHCPRITPLGKAASVALLLAAAAVGGDKSPAMRYVATLVTALRGGALLDPSGRIGAAATIAASQEIASLSGGIIGAASQTVAEAQSQFDAAAYTLTNRTLNVAYIAADLPRALPGVHANSNIAATIQRVRQDGNTNLLVWVWFSEEPAVQPQVSLSYSVEDGVWAYMPAVTNSYPDTVDVDGVPCIEYRYEIPAPYRGTVFRPDYELAFGGVVAGDYLTVPAGGVVVSTNGVECLPYTGTDTYSEHLSVTYKGGIAVSATFHGTNYTGVVTL
ncbi:MAG: hypothetical protein GX590_08070 [Lentisphaerae bacterium]|nr:hypothetical protein [Lentisphaerota bacterium]